MAMAMVMAMATVMAMAMADSLAVFRPFSGIRSLTVRQTLWQF